MYCFLRPVICAGAILLTTLLQGNWNVLLANDSAAEVAAGGIQLRKESRISMEKERLTISLKKVTVEYEFLDTTDQDVTREVAFPIPPYIWTPIDPAGTWDFSDFRVWVNGDEIRYQTDARAKHNGTDCTHLLRQMGIDIQNFGNVDKHEGKSQIDTLPDSARRKLISLGLIEEGGNPYWTVILTYHWTQRFPAHKVLHVRHEYRPMVGTEWIEIAKIQQRFKDACIDSALQQTLNTLASQKLQEAKNSLYPTAPAISARWVKYILTTANTWKAPIRHFELIVEEQEPDLNTQPLGKGMCWHGKVERSNTTRLVARKVNFIPTRELAVYYFSDYIEFKGKSISK